MQTHKNIIFFTLLLLISFASVNAVLFTPALPEIAGFFAVSHQTAQLTITWFLIGYALGQLIYGPLANRFGRKPAIYIGIILQIVSSLICILAGWLHIYALLVVGRLFLALGSSVGLQMTFTIINECYDPQAASQKISHLILAFAVTPSLATALGGILNTHFGWISCFYASACYGVLLLFFAKSLPETRTQLDYQALKFSHLAKSYKTQLCNKYIITGGLLMGGSTSVYYLFAAIAPFIAISILQMNSAEYGFANLLPSIGILLGSIYSAKLAKRFELTAIIKWGILVTVIGTILLIIGLLAIKNAVIGLFLPMIVILFGTTLIVSNASAVAMSKTADKAHGSAVMNFINVGLTCVMVLGLNLFTLHLLLLPALYVGLCILMLLCHLKINLLAAKNMPISKAEEVLS